MAQERKKPGVDRVYRGERVEVTWEPELCIHAGECFGTLPEVFRPRERPWVRPEEAEEPVPKTPILEPQPDGPLYVRGNVRVADEDGNLIREDTRVALCRCGHSGNKPFCDNSHLRVGFTSSPDEASTA